MTDKHIEIAVNDLLQNQTNTTKQLTVFQRLNVLLQKCEGFTFEKNIHNLITTYLNIQNIELQISTLHILITCIKKGLFKSSKDIDIAYLVVDIAHNTVTQSVEHQELWLKAFSALEIMDTLHADLYKTRSFEMVKILQKVVGSVASSRQKMSAIKMLNCLVKTTDFNHNSDMLESSILQFWIEQICPLMFNMNLQILQSCAMDVSYSLLPFLQDIFEKESKPVNTFSEGVQKNYIPILNNLVENENCLFSKLWIFLTKLLGATFHQRCPFVNLLLNIVETAFKSQNNDMRLEAFFCWDTLIEAFICNPNSFFTDKRIKLMTLPLKANNGKTEKIVAMKFQIWCKVLNALDKKNIDFTNKIMDQFLQFCFGPLTEQALTSWAHGVAQMSQGKKFPNNHLMFCKAFLQLIGNRKYMDDELFSKLKFFHFVCPKITAVGISHYSKLIVDSVGECCVMLSQLQNSDRFECAEINEALWKSLFFTIDSMKDDLAKQKCIEEMSALILALTGVARRKSVLITFGLVPLFNIITSNEFKFFKNETMTELLFIPMIQAVMKKDKALLQHDVILIFNKIFQYKRNEKMFLKFVQTVLERFFLVFKENLVPEKLSMLHNMWFLIAEELKNYLLNNSNINELYTSVYCEFFIWPMSTFYRNSSEEKYTNKWKELYHLYGKQTSQILQNKLAVSILKKIHQISSTNPHLPFIPDFVYFVITNLNIKEFPQENYDIYEAYSLLKTFLMTENLEKKALDIYQKCVANIFSASVKCVYYPHCLSDTILDCMNYIFTMEKNAEIVENLKKFVESLEYKDKLIPQLEKLRFIVEHSDIDKNVIDLMLLKIEPLIKTVQETHETKDPTTPAKSIQIKNAVSLSGTKESVKKRRRRNLKGSLEITSENETNSIKIKSPSILQVPKTISCSDTELTSARKSKRSSSLLKFIESPEIPSEDKINSIRSDIDQTIGQTEKQQIVSLLGHDIETMSPVKIKDNTMTRKSRCQPNILRKHVTADSGDFVVVNTPYNFNSKNLTKSQREKLSKRRDDIPALYQDLSQSQTRDFSSDSNSISQPNKTDESKTKEKSSNPFSDLILVQNEAEKLCEISEIKTIDSQHETPDISNVQTNESQHETPVISEMQTNESQFKTPEISEIKTNETPETMPSIDETSENQAVKKVVAHTKNDLKLKIIVPPKKRDGRKKSTKGDQTSKEVMTELNFIEIKEKSRKRRRKSCDEFSNSSESETNTLNTAKLQINSADLNSGDIENVPFKAEKTRGRKPFLRANLNTSKTETNTNTFLENLDSEREFRSAKGRRRSAGYLRKLEVEEISLSNLDTVTKQRVNRELQRIKMDIKHSEEYHKSDKRKTRMSGPSVYEDPDVVKCSPGESTSNSSESETVIEISSKESSQESANSIEIEPVIEDSQEPEPIINIKQCRIPVLYPLEEVKPGEQIVISTGDLKMDVVKGPEPTSPFRIIDSVSNLPQKSITCKEICFSPKTSENNEIPATSELVPEITEQKNTPVKKKIDILSQIIIRTPLKEFEQFEFKNSNTETESLNSEIISEINAENPGIIKLHEDKPEYNYVLSRKVLFNDSTISENSETPKEMFVSPPREQKSGIETSPVSMDTPTRNKELLRSTCEISPIKSLQFEEDLVFDLNKVQTAPTNKNIEPNQISSPELFFSEPSSSGLKSDFESEKRESNSANPSKISRKKICLKPAGGRSAQMMDMVSASPQTNMISSSKKKRHKETKTNETFFSPRKNRIMKMMDQLEKHEQLEQITEEMDCDKIKKEDILTFNKPLPSPFASPSCGILKKRKMSDDPEDLLSKFIKRRRVNFSDPPVSCFKYIEKKSRQFHSTSLKQDIVPPDPPVTRSSKGSEDEIIENTDSFNITDSNRTENNTNMDIPLNTDMFTNTENINNFNSYCEQEIIENTDDNDAKNIVDDSGKIENENLDKFDNENLGKLEESEYNNLKAENKESECENEISEDKNESSCVETQENIEQQKSCEVSVITKNNENSSNSPKHSESMFSESLPDEQDFLNEEPSTSRYSPESVVKWSPPPVTDDILEKEKPIISAIIKAVKERKLNDEMTNNDLANVLNQIYDVVPCGEYSQPAPQETLAEKVISGSDNGNRSDELLDAHVASIVKNYSVSKILQAFTKQIEKNEYEQRNKFH